MSVISYSNFSFPVYQISSFIDSKIQGLLLNPANAPSTQLIIFCKGWFDINKFPDEVKWQLFFAAHAYKSPDGTINLGHNAGGSFFLHSLNYEHLAILYRAIVAYYNEEKRQKGEGQAIFHKHLEIMEERFKELCRFSEKSGLDLIHALEFQNDPHNLSSVIKKIQAYLEELHPPPGGMLNKKLLEACRNNNAYPSNNLLWRLGLIPSPAFAFHIPEEVLWQILFASSAHIKANGEVFLGNNFSVEHLNIPHLVILLQHFIIYNNYEKTELQGKYAIFDKHIKIVAKQIIQGGVVALEQVRQMLDTLLKQKRDVIEQKQTVIEQIRQQALLKNEATIKQANWERAVARSQVGQTYSAEMEKAKQKRDNLSFIDMLTAYPLRPQIPAYPVQHLPTAKYKAAIREAHGNYNDQWNKSEYAFQQATLSLENNVKEFEYRNTTKVDFDNLERLASIHKAILMHLEQELDALLELD